MEKLHCHFSCESNTDTRPTQNVAILTNINGSLQQLNSAWGIKPQWASRLIINAQGETVATKKTFKQSFQSRRCLVPCSSWYEWTDTGHKTKQKYEFTSADGQPLLMAGIWFETETIPQLVTLTTHPNPLCAKYHKRMPVLIRPEAVDYWFNSSVELLAPLLEPVETGAVAVHSC